MTVINPPTFLQASAHPASTVRRAFEGILGSTSGVLEGLSVSQSTTPAMQVEVSTGLVYIVGDTTSYMGGYIGDNQGVETLAVASSDATFARIDLVVARIKDAQYVGADNEFALEVVTGTAAAVPVAPTQPADSLLLATIQVSNGVSSITDAAITDNRVLMSSGAKLVAYGENATNITALTPRTLVSASFTAAANRRHLVRVVTGPFSMSGGANLEVQGVGTTFNIASGTNWFGASSTDLQTRTFTKEVTGLSAGTSTVIVRATEASPGSNAVNLRDDSPCTVEIYDVGPA